MSKHPVKIKRAPTRLIAEPAAEVMPAHTPRRGEVTFRYSHASISLAGNRAHVEARRVEMTGGRLESETFEGDVDPSVFGRAVAEAERQLLAQTALFWQSFASMLPFSDRNRD